MWKNTLLFGLLIGGCVAEKSKNEVIDKPSFISSKFTQKAEVLEQSDQLDNCMSLEVSEADVRNVIDQSKRVEGSEWHYAHVYPPCRFTGEIEYDGEILGYAYYPTGYLSLEGSTAWYMCYECSVNPEWLDFDGLTEN